MSVDVLQTRIDKQDNVEVIRDQIGAILLAEVNNQMALATAAGDDPDDWKLRIYTEASNPWEQFLETPTADKSPIINIKFDSSVFPRSSGNIMKRQKAEAIYNIDCYGYGESEQTTTGHTPGDQLAGLESARAVRLVRNILMSSPNTYLQLRGVVWDRWPQSINAFDPERGVDGVQKIVASRISFAVGFNEFSPQYVPVDLNYIAIDVHRAEDGLLYFEHDFDYTSLTANAASTEGGGAATLVRSKILPANAATTQGDGAADFITGTAIAANAAATQGDGAATLVRSKILPANAATTQGDGGAGLVRAKILGANAATTQGDGAADLISGSTLLANAATTQGDGAATLVRSKILVANSASTQGDGAANFGQSLTATAASTQGNGSATLVKAKILPAVAASTQGDGSATLVRAKILSATAASTQGDGAATLPKSRIFAATAASTQGDGAAGLIRAKILGANAATTQGDGAATIGSAGPTIVGGHDPSTYTHDYTNTSDVPYIETLVPITQNATITTIYAATTASTNTTAWNIGVGSLVGSTFTPSSTYVSLDVWANDPTTAMTNRTFVAGVDFTAFSVTAGQYIAFESIGFGGPAPVIGRNTGGASYRFWNSTGDTLWPEEIGNPLTTTSSTAARLEVGFAANL
jgi:hypothetical protein